MNTEDNWIRNAKWMYLGIAIFASVLFLDVWVFRPREPISEVDKKILEYELETIINATSPSGKWWEKSSFKKGHSSLVVTGTYSAPYLSQTKTTTLVQALQNNGWQPLSSSRAIVMLCKDKYRADLEADNVTGIVSLSFTVKQFKKDTNCFSTNN